MSPFSAFIGKAGDKIFLSRKIALWLKHFLVRNKSQTEIKKALDSVGRFPYYRFVDYSATTSKGISTLTSLWSLIVAL